MQLFVKLVRKNLNVLSAFTLYLGLFFVMIALALFNVLPLNYLGGIVIALFIGGLCYAWLNAWRQTDKIIDVESRKRLMEEKSVRNREASKFEPQMEPGDKGKEKEVLLQTA